ncbi:cell division protein FtsI/penicillin-binding protein 2 [Idiomarina sp. A28L]|uniref:peptidoglycan glycosyltransferase FtsI n=1 Tax=Idiomarina sp. A28L TaxID=1036674 RepID=UPI00021387AE|nr:peptidoglycan glycosyltransferase FtsI [Idiomarina sp. A28L]EGN74846.1 cell division protein FtsI/penicillin-binding protein 2 [Idiomarina sp. A28L]
MAVKRNEKILRPEPLPGRFMFLLVCICLGFVSLVARAAYIQVIEPDRLRYEGDLRSIRVAQDRVQRGNITDRNGVELAVSVPVHTIWADPKVVHDRGGYTDTRRWQAMADVLNTTPEQLLSKVENPERRFVYLERMITPAVANYIRDLRIPGVGLKEESRRFYPGGEIAAHVVGITNIDAEGLDGVESVYNDILTGTPGQRRYRKDGQGRLIEELEITASEQPQNLTLSIDQRIQSVAYRELAKAVRYHQASSGSVVVVDVQTGEVLAMVNNPSYNPNNRSGVQAHQMRNRAITDSFEPGSTVKPLVVLGALASGSVTIDSKLNTSPGWMRVGGRRVQDARNYGELDLSGILAHSSNVGTSRLALDLELEDFLDLYSMAGFGSDTGINMLGESMGMFQHRNRWSDFEVAALSYGYGISVTTLQLAQMYAILGNGGNRQPLSILKLDEPHQGRQVFSREISRQVLQLMEAVAEEGGTGTRARVSGYRVAGKTGTTRKAVAGGYGDEYVGLFAGVLPASRPRVAIAVMINEPAGDSYHGGTVAAPVFSAIAEETMRILNVAPDNLNGRELRVAGFGGGQ